MGLYSLSKKLIIPISTEAGCLMSDLFKTLKEVIKLSKINSNSIQKRDEQYLAQSNDLFDLERRQKEIDSRFTRKL